MNQSTEVIIDIWTWCNSDAIGKAAPGGTSSRVAHVQLDTMEDLEKYFDRNCDLSLLGARELEQLGRLKTESLQRAYAFRHTVLKKMLGQYLYRESRQVSYSYNEFDKPSLSGEWNAGLNNPIAFSLSSCRLTQRQGAMAIAIARYGNMRTSSSEMKTNEGLETLPPLEVGVDIEYCDDQLDLGLTAKVFMHSSELNHWNKSDDSRKSKLFYALWSTKEAVLKCAGCGMHKDPREVCLERLFEGNDSDNNVRSSTSRFTSDDGTKPNTISQERACFDRFEVAAQGFDRIHPEEREQVVVEPFSPSRLCYWNSELPPYYSLALAFPSRLQQVKIRRFLLGDFLGAVAQAGADC